MGLLNGIMPGEWGGMPTQQGGLLGGAFDNPLFQMGIGILANNSGHYGALGPAIGGGLQQASHNIQRQKQLAMEKEWRDMQMKESKLKLDQYEKEQKALADFDTKFPAYAGLASIDPKAALKIAYPTLASNSADPYFSDRYIGGKVYSFNHRTGEYEEKSLPNSLPNKDDPNIRGAVKSAEAQAGAAWKPNTDIDGQVLTDAQVAQMAYGNNPIPFSGGQPQAPQLPSNNFNTPYPITFGAPGTTATDRAEGVTSDASIQLRNPARPNVGPGIRVPTKAEQAQIEANIQANKEVDVAGRKQEAESKAKKASAMSGIGSIIDEARGVLTGSVKPTSSMAGAAMDSLGAMVGFAPEGAAEADRLKAIGGALVAKMPRMEGPQSNFDVQNYQVMAGNVSDNTLPISRRLAALDEVERLWRKYDKSGPEPQQSARPSVKPSRTPMKGQVVDGYKFMGGNPADPNNWKRQ
jgi:hypothetical protein